jgi:homoserine dehydrogenase
MTTTLARFERAEYAVPRSCKVALVGFGTVGSSVARLLCARGEAHLLQLTHVCNRNVARKKVDWTPPHVMWTDNIDEVLSSDADVIVELLGGLQPAHDWVRRALHSGKSVVTANKQLMAHFGCELLDLAQAKQQFLGFGACVAGGVPVLSGLQDGLAGDRIIQVRGILNGTCNYILTRLERGGASFAEALAEAQCAGFAESDPTDDIDGLDAGAKLAILARVGLNIHLQPQQVACDSIRHVSTVDFEYARELGCTIRQISTARLVDGRIYAAVGPAMVPRDSPLAKISGSQNLVVSTGEFGGDTVFSGHGAGGNPTAVAVVSDLLQAAMHQSNGATPRHRSSVTTCEVTADSETQHYVRFVVRDKPGILASLAGRFSWHNINLDAVLQRPGYDKSKLPFVITLEPCRKSHLRATLAEIAGFDFLVEAPLSMPILQNSAIGAMNAFAL